MGSEWIYCSKETKYSDNGKLRLVAWNAQRFLLPDIVRDLEKELFAHQWAALLDYSHDRRPGAHKDVVDFINKGVADTIIAQKICEYSGTNESVFETNKKRSWLRGAVYCGFIKIEELMNVQMGIQNNIRDLSLLYHDAPECTRPKYDSATIAYVLNNPYKDFKGTLKSELTKSELGRTIFEYVANGSDIVPDFNSNIPDYKTYPVLDWRVLQNYGGVKTYADLAELYCSRGQHDKLIALAVDIFSQKVDGKQYWEKDETMLQFARIKYYVGKSYYRKKNYETAAAKLIDGLNINKKAENFDRELTVEIYRLLGKCRKKLGGSKEANYAEAKRIEEGGDIDRNQVAAVEPVISKASKTSKISKKWVIRGDFGNFDEYGGGIPAATRGQRPHYGLDISKAYNKPVISNVNGKIVAKNGTQDNRVIVRINGDTCGAYFYTWKSKPIGTEIKIGDTIAYCCYRDFYPKHPASISHIHFEVRIIKNGNYSDFGKYNRDALQRSRVLNPFPYVLGDDCVTKMPKDYQALIQKLFDDYAAGKKGCEQQVRNAQNRFNN